MLLVGKALNVEDKMKKMKWLGGVVLGIILTCVTNYASAQYTTALGVRLGGTSGITFKHLFTKDKAVELILGTFSNGYSLTGLLEKQNSLNAEGFYFYYGGGVHIATYDGSSYEHFGRDVQTNETKGMAFGVNGVLGLEYRLPNHIPIVFSVDTKPFVEFGSSNYFGFAFDPSISIKFVIL